MILMIPSNRASRNHFKCYRFYFPRSISESYTHASSFSLEKSTAQPPSFLAAVSPYTLSNPRIFPHAKNEPPEESLPQGVHIKSATTYFHAPFPANYLGHE